MSGFACPADGTSMNRHGELLREPIDDSTPIDPVMGAVVVEVFTCPLCGRSQSRPVPPLPS